MARFNGKREHESYRVPETPSSGVDIDEIEARHVEESHIGKLKRGDNR